MTFSGAELPLSPALEQRPLLNGEKAPPLGCMGVDVYANSNPLCLMTCGYVTPSINGVARPLFIWRWMHPLYLQHHNGCPCCT